MKTVMCDICRLTKEDLELFTNKKIYRFKASLFEEPTRIDKFDICGRCLSRIADEIQNAKAGGQNE